MIRKGFTLIELLVVLVIIGILAGLIMPMAGRAMKQSKVGVAKSQMAFFETVHWQIYNDIGYYVRLNDFSKSDSELVRCFDYAFCGQDDYDIDLVELPAETKFLWNKPYYIFKNVTGENQPLDPWQHPYRIFWLDKTFAYNVPKIPAGNDGVMVCISAGANGVLESLTGFPKPEDATNFETFNPNNIVDDVINPFVCGFQIFN